MTMNIWRLRLLAFVFPLLLVGLFLFEGNRIGSYALSPEQLVQTNIRLQAAHDVKSKQLRAQLIEQEKYNATPRRPSNNPALDKRMAESLEVKLASLREQVANQEKPAAVRKEWVSKSLIASLGYTGAAIALLTCLVGGLILLRAGQWKTAALQSRDALLSAFEASQKLMPKLLTWLLVLTAASAAVFAALEVSGLFLPVPEYLTRRENSKLFLYYMLFVGLTVIVALMLTWFSIRVMRQLSRAFQHASDPSEVMGRLVSRAEAPALWQAVDEVAAKLSAPVPKNIIIGMDDGFYVTEHEIKLEPSKAQIQGQTLYLSAPRMTLLSPEEILFIIGHELGHFAGDDTTYSKRFSPLYGKALRTNNILEEQKASVARHLNEFVLETFDLAILHWSRVREFAADQSGKTISGGLASASALLRLVTTDPVLYNHYVDLRKSDNGSNALVLLHKGTQSTALADTHAELKKDIPHPTDTHPPTQERAKILAADSLKAAFAAASRPIDDKGVRWLREMIINFDTTYQTIAEEYAKTVKGHVEAYKAELRDMIADVNVVGNSVVYERTSWIWYLLPALPAIVTLLVLYRWIFPSGPPLSNSSEFLRVASALGVTLVLAGVVWLRHRLRSGKPFVTLTPAGIESPSFQRSLTWTEIKDYAVVETDGQFLTSFTITIKLSPDTVFGLRDRNGFRFKYKTNKNNFDYLLLLTYKSPLKGMKDEAFLTLFNNYYNGALAKSELESLEKE
jgi:Zn-dependent protease with chaperone function